MTTKEMLIQLTRAFPPQRNRAHCLYLHTDGALRLVLYPEGVSHIILTEVDLGQPLDQLIASIRLFLAKTSVMMS